MCRYRQALVCNRRWSFLSQCSCLCWSRYRCLFQFLCRLEEEDCLYAIIQLVWPNFLKRFRLKASGYIEPKPGIPPTPSHTVEIINMMREKKIPVILMEPYFDDKTPKAVEQKTGAKLLRFIPSVGGVPEAKDYLSLFDYDVKLLADALAAKKGGKG